MEGAREGVREEIGIGLGVAGILQVGIIIISLTGGDRGRERKAGDIIDKVYRRFRK